MNAREWAVALCESLGLDPSKTTRLVIEADPGVQLRVWVETLEMLEGNIGFSVPPEDICDVTFGKAPE